jgi:hypothetical protein
MSALPDAPLSPEPCTRRPHSGEPLGSFCRDCGHASLMHSTQGDPCAVCALHAAAAAVRGDR